MTPIRKKYLFIISALALVFSSFHPEKKRDPVSDPPTCRKIIKDMLDSIRHLRTLRYSLYAVERIGTKYLKARSELKIHINPRKLYFINREKKLEILWKQGWNNNEAHIKRNTFPFLSLNLDPYGSLMRKDQHHTLHELGFAYIGNVVARSVLRDPKHLQKYFTYTGDTTWNNRPCYIVENNFPDFKYVEYTVGKNETVYTISQKFNAPDYLVRVKNGLAGNYEILKEGKKLRVPNNYSVKTVFFIDKLLKLPIKISVKDDQGLYEVYEFTGLIVNSEIHDEEFTKEYKGYNF